MNFEPHSMCSCVSTLASQLERWIVRSAVLEEEASKRSCMECKNGHVFAWTVDRRRLLWWVGGSDKNQFVKMRWGGLRVHFQGSLPLALFFYP